MPDAARIPDDQLAAAFEEALREQSRRKWAAARIPDDQLAAAFERAFDGGAQEDPRQEQARRLREPIPGSPGAFELGLESILGAGEASRQLLGAISSGGGPPPQALLSADRAIGEFLFGAAPEPRPSRKERERIRAQRLAAAPDAGREGPDVAAAPDAGREGPDVAAALESLRGALAPVTQLPARGASALAGAPAAIGAAIPQAPGAADMAAALESLAGPGISAGARRFAAEPMGFISLPGEDGAYLLRSGEIVPESRFAGSLGSFAEPARPAGMIVGGRPPNFVAGGGADTRRVETLTRNNDQLRERARRAPGLAGEAREVASSFAPSAPSPDALLRGELFDRFKTRALRRGMPPKDVRDAFLREVSQEAFEQLESMVAQRLMDDPRGAESPDARLAAIIDVLSPRGVREADLPASLALNPADVRRLIERSSNLIGRVPAEAEPGAAAGVAGSAREHAGLTRAEWRRLTPQQKRDAGIKWREETGRTARATAKEGQFQQTERRLALTALAQMRSREDIAQRGREATADEKKKDRASAAKLADQAIKAQADRAKKRQDFDRLRHLDDMAVKIENLRRNMGRLDSEKRRARLDHILSIYGTWSRSQGMLGDPVESGALPAVMENMARAFEVLPGADAGAEAAFRSAIPRRQ